MKPSEKEDLRSRMRGLRGAIETEERARLAHEISERLFSLPFMRDVRAVMLYSSFGTEVPTSAIAERVRSRGARTLFPFLQAGRIVPAWVDDDGQLVASRYGPREPAARVAVSLDEIEVVVVPGLAFDRDGFRLGYGGGHYDRLIADLGPGTRSVGVAFHSQLLASVPRNRLDRPVDAVVTDVETMIPTRKR